MIKQAEEQLKAVSQQPGYGITVLKVCFVFERRGVVRTEQVWQQEAACAPTPTPPCHRLVVLALLSTPPCLAQVVAAGDALGLSIRLAAGVNFKNLVKYRWVGSGGGTGGRAVQCLRRRQAAHACAHELVQSCLKRVWHDAQLHPSADVCRSSQS